MNTLKSIVMGLAFGYGALACGPDSVNNYYGTGGKGGSAGSYTCDDIGEVERACLSKEEPQDQGFAVEFANTCKEFKFSRDCIDCIATAPCTIISNGTPTGNHLEDQPSYCMKQGRCPEFK